MAREVEPVNDDSKAKARHAKIAKDKKKASEDAVQKIEDEIWKAKKAEDRRKEYIKKLPKDEQAKAKAEFKEQVKARKENEKELKAKIRELKRAEKEVARAPVEE